MEQTKVFTIQINGTETVLKDVNTVQKELVNAGKVLKAMGIPKSSIEDIKKFNKELNKVVDTAKLTEKEIKDLGKAFKNAAKEAEKLEEKSNGGVSGGTVIGRGGKLKALQGIVSNLAVAAGPAGVALAVVAAGSVAAYEGMSNLVQSIEETNVAASELFDNSVESEKFAEEVRVLSETFGTASADIIKETDDMVKAQEELNKELKLIGKEEELTHQDALKRIKEREVAKQMSEGKSRDEIAATIEMNKRLVLAENELVENFNSLSKINTSGFKIAAVEIGSSLLSAVGDIQDSFSGVNDSFSELTGGFSILDVSLGVTKTLLEYIVKPIQMIGEGLVWLLDTLNAFKNSD
jgi:hypothetical protein